VLVRDWVLDAVGVDDWVEVFEVAAEAEIEGDPVVVLEAAAVLDPVAVMETIEGDAVRVMLADLVCVVETVGVIVGLGEGRWPRVNVVVCDSVLVGVAVVDGVPVGVVDAVVSSENVVVWVAGLVLVTRGVAVAVAETLCVLVGGTERVVVNEPRDAVIEELAVVVRVGRGVLEWVGVCVCVLERGPVRVGEEEAVVVLEEEMEPVAVVVIRGVFVARVEAVGEGLAVVVREGGADLVKEEDADWVRVGAVDRVWVGDADDDFEEVVVEVWVRVVVVVFVEVVEPVAVLEGGWVWVASGDALEDLEGRAVTVVRPVERMVSVERVDRVDVVDGHAERVEVVVFVLVLDWVAVVVRTRGPSIMTRIWLA